MTDLILVRTNSVMNIDFGNLILTFRLHCMCDPLLPNLNLDIDYAIKMLTFLASTFCKRRQQSCRLHDKASTYFKNSAKWFPSAWRYLTIMTWFFSLEISLSWCASALLFMLIAECVSVLPYWLFSSVLAIQEEQWASQSRDPISN